MVLILPTGTLRWPASWRVATVSSFVEAKANKAELKIEGKALIEKASGNSLDNHNRIDGAIEEACIGLRAIDRSVAISRDRCCQLSNRPAFAWKLENLGTPSVLATLDSLATLALRMPVRA